VISAGLAIPRLSGVPVQMVANYDAGHAAAVALAFLDSGHLEPQHWSREWAAPIELCDRAIAAWWRKAHPTFEVLPALYCHVSRDDDRQHYFDDESPQSKGLRVHVGRRDQGRDLPRLHLHRRVRRLERACPGLGFRALRLLDLAAMHTVQILTPWTAYGMASYAHWQGSNDEQDALQMYRDEGEDGVDVYTRAEFLREIPEDAIRFSWRAGNWVPPRRSSPDPRVMDSCAAIAARSRAKAMKRLNDADARRIEGFAWVDFGAIARWNERDDCLRMADDWFQAVSRDETWETFGSWDVPLESGAIRQFFADLGEWLAMAGELDRMLALLGERE
jgi:PRTRC genetic system protein F